MSFKFGTSVLPTMRLFDSWYLRTYTYDSFIAEAERDCRQFCRYPVTTVQQSCVYKTTHLWAWPRWDDKTLLVSTRLALLLSWKRYPEIVLISKISTCGCFWCIRACILSDCWSHKHTISDQGNKVNRRSYWHFTDGCNKMSAALPFYRAANV